MLQACADVSPAAGQRASTWWTSLVVTTLLEEVTRHGGEDMPNQWYFALPTDGRTRWLRMTRLMLTGPPDHYLQEYLDRPITGFVEVRQKWWSFQPGDWITHHAFIILEVAGGRYHILCEKVTNQLEIMFGAGPDSRGFMKEFRATGQPRHVTRCFELPRQPVTSGVTVRQLLEWMEGPLRRRWQPYSLLHSNCQHFAGELQEFVHGPGELELKRGTPEHVLAAIRNNSRALQFATPELQADPAFVYEAVRQNWRALSYAPPELQRLPRLALAAVSQDGYALQNLVKELRGDRQVVLTAVRQNGHALQHAPDEMRSSREVVLAAVAQAGEALQYAQEKFRRDRQVVLAAVRQCGHALRYVSAAGRRDREVVLEAVKQSGSALQYAAEDMRRDAEIALIAGWSDPTALQYAFA